MITKICGACGNSFHHYPYRSPKYCGQQCYFDARWKANNCRYCEKPITQNRYCDVKCRNAFWSKNEYRLLKKKRLWERKRALVSELGGKCENCGTSDERILDIDHIDASKKIKVPKNLYTMSSRLVAWSKEKDNLRLLCANCHRIRTWEQFDYANLG